MRTLLLGLALITLLTACTGGRPPVLSGRAQPSTTRGDHKAPRKSIALVDDCFNASIRPKKMVFACADFGFRARSLTWSQWNRKSASGRGVFVINDCDPNCAAGTFHRRQGRITLEEVGSCDNLTRLVFMSGRVVYETPFEGRSAETIHPDCPIS